MGHLPLMRLMAMKRERRRLRRKRRRQHALAPDESIASMKKRKSSSYQQVENTHSDKRLRYSVPYLPEGIWQHIHSLMPMGDAGRAACLSSAFLYSWRNRPKLTFSTETIGIVERRPDFIRKIDRIMKKHSGIGVEALTIEFMDLYTTKARSYLERWLQIVVTPRIEELSLMVSPLKRKSYYDFPCSLLSNGNGSSIRLLDLHCCTFHPTPELGCFQSLTRLHLERVIITGDELGCLLSSSSVLERLELRACYHIEHLKLPSTLQQLSYMEVCDCCRLRRIENEAPNLYSLHLSGWYFSTQLCFGESSLVKNLRTGHFFSLYRAFAELPSIFPNLETFAIRWLPRMGDAPMVPNTFCHLKYLSILQTTRSASFDYLSLVSFLDACPSLDTFILNSHARHSEDDSIIVNPSDLRQLPGQYHGNLRDVKITRFCSAKSLVELTCHILKNTSVERLTLDTTECTLRCSPGETGRCSYIMDKNDLLIASRALLAIRTYIEGRVPSTVKLNVVEPCGRCYVIPPFRI
ncbi:uncharacterized protein LOC102705101 [Oryza brachyantha]|uniref:At1g61320/AtMIF1 LRR domain-containing protein n=1 Tax=Oryza brachyantha TaxID=4533 RepID=J3MZ36_ORYBR|nr:uncharacterized protein LOC102705101 [Oryza brachyantha]XP_040383751.1 uncharacterized protein LOC102705101 [Oryza brachyantha]